MNNVKRVSLIVISMLGCISFSLENEFIKQPKQKKFYPSCPQCLELKVTKIVAINNARQACNNFEKLLNDIEAADIAMMTAYVDGDKDCFLQQATKHQRADLYAKDDQVKQILDGYAMQIENMRDQLKKNYK